MLYACGKIIVPPAEAKTREFDPMRFNYLFTEAVKHKIMGNAGEALKLLEQCIKVNPGSAASYYQMAQIVVAGGNTAKGISYLKRAVMLEPENPWYFLMLAGTYYQEKKIDSAIIYYEKAVALNPEKEDMKITLANLYSENRKFEKAKRIYETLDNKYGVNQTSTAGGIKNLMWAGQYDEALKKTELLLNEFPDEILYNGLLAEIYRELGEPDKAMEIYNRLIERNPANPEIQLSLCDFLLTEKRYGDLFLLLNTVILNEEIMREDKLSLFARMIEISEITEKNSDKLLLSLMIMEAQYKNDHIVQLLRPELLSQEKKYNEAAARLEEIISYQPDNYFAWEKLLLVYLDSGNMKKLEERARECATRFNRSFLAKILYATGAGENGNINTAMEELRKADILAGNDKELKMQVLSIKADLLYKNKQYEDAFKTFDEAIRTDGEDIIILNNYAYYLAEQGLRLKEAEKMAAKVISTERDNYTFLDTYGWVLYKRGKNREAEKIFREIVKDGGGKEAVYFEHYGFVLKRRKNCKDAVIHWNKAIEADTTKKYLNKEIEKCKSSR